MAINKNHLSLKLSKHEKKILFFHLKELLKNKKNQMLNKMQKDNIYDKNETIH